ncbi:MAG: glycosyltransferase [Verrucomicrobiota bacterium JB025]|nr:glycosyltransferase family 2 protein [Verrucomicrobiota bacterium JB025]
MSWVPGWICLGFALVPAALCVWNLWLYRRLPDGDGERRRMSVLIPARNEAGNIEACLESVLASEGVELEVVVLDDGSTDGTAEAVGRIMRRDSRVVLADSQPLPSGWCGKTFACKQLTELASHGLMVFLDADVRVSRRDSLARLSARLEAGDGAMWSGVPREVTGSAMERLVIPLIHFVLLGFLPILGMRRSTAPSYAAACGQVVAVRRPEYLASGGHDAIAASLHDGVALARSFRRHGLATDLFDATDTFHCRMYVSAREVWDGFVKNAHEALAAPRMILPMSVVLFTGQVLPFLLVLWAAGDAALPVVLAVVLAYLPRVAGVLRFRQSVVGAVLHPVGICVLLAIQWCAFFRSLRKVPASWKGRHYQAADAG